jgi:hypothetical protein
MRIKRGATAVMVVALATTAACGSGTPHQSRDAASTTVADRTARPVDLTPHVLASAHGSSPTGFIPAVMWRGQTAAWIARSATGVALMSFDQRLMRLALHSGTVESRGSGWRNGASIRGAERTGVIAVAADRPRRGKL